VCGLRHGAGSAQHGGIGFLNWCRLMGLELSIGRRPCAILGEGSAHYFIFFSFSLFSSFVFVVARWISYEIALVTLPFYSYVESPGLFILYMGLIPMFQFESHLFVRFSF